MRLSYWRIAYHRIAILSVVMAVFLCGGGQVLAQTVRVQLTAQSTFDPTTNTCIPDLTSGPLLPGLTVRFTRAGESFARAEISTVDGPVYIDVPPGFYTIEAFIVDRSSTVQRIFFQGQQISTLVPTTSTGGGTTLDMRLEQSARVLLPGLPWDFWVSPYVCPGAITATGNEPPQITSLDIPSETVDNVITAFPLGYFDLEGDISSVLFERETNGIWSFVDSVPLIETDQVILSPTTGTLELTSVCGPLPPSVARLPLHDRAILVDTAGNQSVPFEFNYVCVRTLSPAILGKTTLFGPDGNQITTLRNDTILPNSSSRPGKRTKRDCETVFDAIRFCRTMPVNARPNASYVVTDMVTNVSGVVLSRARIVDWWRGITGGTTSTECLDVVPGGVCTMNYRATGTVSRPPARPPRPGKR